MIKRCSKLLIKVTAFFLLISCGKTQEEQMLFDFQQKEVSNLNLDLNDLDFRIEEIKELGQITSKDSMKIKKMELASYWKENPDQHLIDTLTFEYVIGVLNENIALNDTLYKLYQESVLTAIKFGDYSFRYESEKKRDDALKKMFEYKELAREVKELENYYKAISEHPDSVLSVKYYVVYSLKNPIMSNAKQTFRKTLYTDASHTSFLGELNKKNDN